MSACVLDDRVDTRSDPAASVRKELLPSSVTSRPIKGDTPTIDLVLGYNKASTSDILKLFLARVDRLIARAA